MKRNVALSGSRPLALVTGASSGLGAAFARRLAAQGHDLLLVARRLDRLERLASELAAQGVSTQIVAADLARSDGLVEVEAKIAAGRIVAVLVNAAGFGTRRRFAEIERDCTLAMIHLHVIAPVALARAVLPKMIANRRGRIINVSSMAALFASEHYVTYSATKAYLNMFTEGLQAELKGTGVRAQIVCAGLTRTGFFDSPEFAAFKFQRVPDWMWMTPEAVVDEVLASDRPFLIPGRHNRMFVALLRTPVLGKVVGRTVERLNEKLGGLY